MLRRLQDELTALGADPEPEALAKAPYLEAVCNETLRLRPPSPGVGRKLNAPMQIAGYELPAGAGVFAQIIWAHHDPAVFLASYGVLWRLMASYGVLWWFGNLRFSGSFNPLLIDVGIVTA